MFLLQALSVLTGLSITQNVTCVKSNSQLNHWPKEHIERKHQANMNLSVFKGWQTFSSNSKFKQNSEKCPKSPNEVGQDMIFLAITPKNFQDFQKRVGCGKAETCHKRAAAVARSFPPKHQIGLRPSQGERRRRVLPRSAFWPNPAWPWLHRPASPSWAILGLELSWGGRSWA